MIAPRDINRRREAREEERWDAWYALQTKIADLSGMCADAFLLIGEAVKAAEAYCDLTDGLPNHGRHEDRIGNLLECQTLAGKLDREMTAVAEEMGV